MRIEAGPDRLSKGIVLVCMAVLLVMRWISLTPNELSWDVFGYYLYLPATFVHGDPLLTDIGWVRQVMEQYHTTETLYQLSTAPDDRTPMYFFLMGMALCYLPFFLLGHGLAWVTGAPMDGFSMPYQMSMAMGALVYTAIGLWQLRAVLRRFFDDRLVAVILLLLVLATNLLHFASAKNLETANFLFCMMSVLLGATVRWHEARRRSDLFLIAASIALITLIKPSEIVCGLVPLFWGVHDSDSFRAKWRMLIGAWKDLLPAVLLGLLILLPQLLYWYTFTGHFIHDSYKNPGVGLDLTSPHILDVLFSFRKGWLIYTPIMVLALLGFVPLYKQRPGVFWPIVLYATTAFYIISSWSEWWYGASYSVRPMITLYPLLSIPFGMALQKGLQGKGVLRGGFVGVLVLLVVHNLFQLWQFRSWIIHPYRTTKDYYFAVFGRTHIPVGAERLLSVDRNFAGNDRMQHDRTYAVVHTYVLGGADHPPDILDAQHPYGLTWEMPYEELTRKEYLWIRARAAVRPLNGVQAPSPCLVFEIRRKEGAYGYRTVCADTLEAGPPFVLRGEYMTPSIRDTEDVLRVYLWSRGEGSLEQQRLEIVVLEEV
ncbi:MAG TPA: hypothetical protein VGE21_09235 [Flavobacteriales bacterium]